MCPGGTCITWATDECTSAMDGNEEFRDTHWKWFEHIISMLIV